MGIGDRGLLELVDTRPVHEIVRHIRERARVSLRQLEQSTGINRGRISDIERGHAPTAGELNALLDAIDVLRQTERESAPRQRVGR